MCVHVCGDGGGALKKKDSWEIFKMPFVRSLFFAFRKPYCYSCHLFGPVTLCHISSLVRHCFWCPWIWKRLLLLLIFLAGFVLRKPRMERICGHTEAFWIINANATLCSNWKLETLLNNEWISRSDLILILYVSYVPQCEKQRRYMTWRSAVTWHFYILP